MTNATGRRRGAHSLASRTPARRIPLWVKLGYTAFMAVLVPFYWVTYGPTNFLYFCDVALFMALIAVWTEEPLWASMPAVGIFLPQLLWQVDFLGGLAGVRVVGMTDYMFRESIPLFARALSFFHFWLPLFLLWVVWRLGYDRRALAHWTAVAVSLLLVCYFLMPAPPAPPNSPNLPNNINYVYGFSEKGPQSWLHPLAYFALLLAALPLVVYVPTHFLFQAIFPSAAGQLARTASRQHASRRHPTRRSSGLKKRKKAARA